ncbi:MAG: hypothetical protein EBQ99_08185 [Planctomycetes bacterium]|nr:hypothetical protein [Planctomycetota bacterium]
MSRWRTAILTCLLLALPAGAQSLEGITAAQAAYDRGMELQSRDASAAREQFVQAASGFRQAIDAGAVNGGLLFNLGNAQLQAGQTGEAIGSYLRAQRLMPGDAGLQANLAHARSLVKDRFDRGGGLLLEDVAGWWHLLGVRSRFTLAAVLWVAAWGAAAWLLLTRSRTPDRLRRLTRSAAWIAGSLAAVLMATVGIDTFAPQWRPLGVTIADGVVVRKGNGDGFAPAFAEPLSQGVEFRVLEERPGWIQIRLPDGKTGWIKDLQASTA